MTELEELMFEYQEIKDARARDGVTMREYIIKSAALGVLPMTFYVTDSSPVFVLSVVAWGCVAFAWWRMVYRETRLVRKRARFRDKLMCKTEHVAPRKLLNAMEQYGYEYGPIAALECDLVHLPGDCPLCGAK